jgi:hypothetical protein
VHGLATAPAQPGEVSKGGTSQGVQSGCSLRNQGGQVRGRGHDSRADIDLEVYRVAGGELELDGFSASASGTEKVDLGDPVPGDYVAVALPFADPPGASSTSLIYRGFVVGPDVGNLTVSPANPTASSGVPFTVKASRSGLDPSAPYLGLTGLR